VHEYMVKQAYLLLKNQLGGDIPQMSQFVGMEVSGPGARKWRTRTIVKGAWREDIDDPAWNVGGIQCGFDPSSTHFRNADAGDGASIDIPILRDHISFQEGLAGNGLWTTGYIGAGGRREDLEDGICIRQPRNVCESELGSGLGQQECQPTNDTNGTSMSFRRSSIGVRGGLPKLVLGIFSIIPIDSEENTIGIISLDRFPDSWSRFALSLHAGRNFLIARQLNIRPFVGVGDFGPTNEHLIHGVFTIHIGGSLEFCLQDHVIFSTTMEKLYDVTYRAFSPLAFTLGLRFY